MNKKNVFEFFTKHWLLLIIIIICIVLFLPVTKNFLADYSYNLSSLSILATFSLAITTFYFNYTINKREKEKHERKEMERKIEGIIDADWLVDPDNDNDNVDPDNDNTGYKAAEKIIELIYTSGYELEDFEGLIMKIIGPIPVARNKPSEVTGDGMIANKRYMKTRLDQAKEAWQKKQADSKDSKSPSLESSSEKSVSN